jgi:hypothetical protein
MRRAQALGAAFAGLALAGCGASSPSSAPSATSAQSTAPGVSTVTSVKPPGKPAPSPRHRSAGATPAAQPAGVHRNRIYQVVLSGTAKGSKASATATIRALGSKREICWAFSDLVAFAHPAAGHINIGAAGSAGSVVVALGSHYTANGCTTAPVATIDTINANPPVYYVELDASRHGNGGASIRSQLAPVPG